MAILHIFVDKSGFSRGYTILVTKQNQSDGSEMIDCGTDYNDGRIAEFSSVNCPKQTIGRYVWIRRRAADQGNFLVVCEVVMWGASARYLRTSKLL